MKNVIAIISFMLTLAVLSLTPSWAQRAGEMMPRGRIIDVNGRSAVIALYYQAPQGANGQVPDEFARQIAKLRGLAEQLQRKGETEQAQRLLQHIERLKNWREVQYSITDWANIQITGLRVQPLDRIKNGMKLRMTVEVNGNDRGLPDQGTLAKNVEQLDDNARTGFRRLPAEGKRTFIEVIGEVTATNPLTVSVGNNSLQVDILNRYRLIERTELTPRDLRPGNRVITDAVIGDDGKVRSLHSLMAYDPNDIDIDATSEDM